VTLREKTLRAIAEVHSGNGTEGERIADAALAALRQWLADEGLVVVPKKMTGDMAIAAGEGVQRSIGSWGEPELAWDYALAAAPDALRDGE
jgi:hypothetical protein